MNRPVLLGDRVRVSPSYHWAQGVTGVVIGGVSGDAMKYQRVVRSNDGLLTYYFVAFDVPQIDAEGDGPYIGGEIDARYVELLSA